MFRLLVWLGGAALLAAPATLQRHPYLQGVSADGASILWTTAEEPGRGEVVLTAPSGETIRAASTVRPLVPAETGMATTYYQHRADIRGLSAGTRYGYQVLLDGREALPDARLELMTPGLAPLTFLVLGDSGDGGPGQELVAAWMRREPAAFWLHVGDLAYEDGTFAQFEKYFFEVYRDILWRVPFFPAPGNHDYYFRDAAAYRTVFAVPVAGVPESGRGRYYSFDWGTMHVVVLDSNAPLWDPTARAAMLRWLEADLERTRRFWRIAVIHHTPFPTGHHRSDATSALVAAQVTPILERQQVHLVFSGHEHNYQRTQPRSGGVFQSGGWGTTYITTGGGGASTHLPGDAPFVEAKSIQPHYLAVDVSGARMTVRAVDWEGRLIDQFSLSAEPRIAEGGVVNAASYTPAIAPGSLIAIFGKDLAAASIEASSLPLPLELGGTEAALGAPLPLLFVSRRQVNAQLPWQLRGELRLRLRNPAGETEVAVTLQETAPAVFMLGAGPAIAHLDGQLVSETHPATPGEWLIAAATGLGRVRGDAVAGQPALPLAAEAPVQVSVAEAQAEVSYAGLMPGLAGVYQVNLRVPGNTRGGKWPLRLTAGAQSSRPVILVVR